MKLWSVSCKKQRATIMRWMTSMKRLAVLLFLLPSVALSEGTNFTAESAASYLRLVQPVRVIFAGGYMDGGSVGFSLADSSTNVFHMFEDHDMANNFVGKTNLPQKMRDRFEHGVNTAGRIYIADDKPRRGGRLTSVEEGMQIKAAVECLALAWLDREFSPDVQTKFSHIIDLSRKNDMSHYKLRDELMPPRRTDEGSYEYFERCRPVRYALYITATLKQKR